MYQVDVGMQYCVFDELYGIKKNTLASLNTYYVSLKIIGKFCYYELYPRCASNDSFS